MPQNEKWQADRDTLRFLLDHPRRCYTNLFPQKHTWWLALALIVLNGLDWSMFEVLNVCLPQPNLPAATTLLTSLLDW